MGSSRAIIPVQDVQPAPQTRIPPAMLARPSYNAFTHSPLYYSLVFEPFRHRLFHVVSMEQTPMAKWDAWVRFAETLHDPFTLFQQTESMLYQHRWLADVIRSTMDRLQKEWSLASLHRWMQLAPHECVLFHQFEPAFHTVYLFVTEKTQGHYILDDTSSVLFARHPQSSVTLLKHTLEPIGRFTPG